jgi:hypothetical protein
MATWDPEKDLELSFALPSYRIAGGVYFADCYEKDFRGN